MGVEYTPGQNGRAEGREKKFRFFRPLFQKIDFGHLFLSILKKMKKGCQKNHPKNEV